MRCGERYRMKRVVARGVYSPEQTARLVEYRDLQHGCSMRRPGPRQPR